MLDADPQQVVDLVISSCGVSMTVNARVLFVHILAMSYLLIGARVIQITECTAERAKHREQQMLMAKEIQCKKEYFIFNFSIFFFVFSITLFDTYMSSH